MQTYQEQAQTRGLGDSNMLQAAAVAAASATNSNHQHNNNLFSLQQQQQQQQQQIQANQQYQQELVIKSYLSQQQQLAQQQRASILSASSLVTPSSAASGGSMVSFAARLMSLNPYELKCLNGDHELMRRIGETHMLMESRLRELNNSSSATTTPKGHQRASAQSDQHKQHNQQQLNKIYQQQQQQQQMLSPLDLNLKQPLQEQQQAHFLSTGAVSPADGYYQNYYAQQLMAAQHQMAQQFQQQQQQLYLLSSSHFNPTHQQQQGQHSPPNNGALGQCSAANIDAGLAPLSQKFAGCGSQYLLLRAGQPALDLRTTPTRPISTSPLSPHSSRASSATSSAGPAPQQNQSNNNNRQQHPKKLKLSEYCRQNNANLVAAAASSPQALPCDSANVSGSSSSSSDRENQHLNHIITPNTDTNCNQKRPYQDESSGSATSSTCLPPSGNTITASVSTTATKQTCAGSSKKYKGEFDEPSPDEVAQRQQQLNRPDHYHRHALERGQCACVIGSEFGDKSKQEALQLLDDWRALDIEQRVKWKWDVNDLPKDIPLSDIKKFEDLRRDFSAGRADFGGASKRKPLGIRGTRQFLLMLYCLWGHPGREDPMQQRGYCPHCFARIRTENEQSTLVRVVNHFNMKHRRGANPRLSPRLEAVAAANQSSSLAANSIRQKQAAAATVADSQPQLEVARALLSMVESASVAPAGGRRDKSPHLDLENLDPRSSVGAGANTSPNATAKEESSATTTTTIAESAASAQSSQAQGDGVLASPQTTKALECDNSNNSSSRAAEEIAAATAAANTLAGMDPVVDEVGD